jgi:hypothetical protein
MGSWGGLGQGSEPDLLNMGRHRLQGLYVGLSSPGEGGASWVVGVASEGVVKQLCRVGSWLMDQTGLLNGPVVDQVFPEVVKMDYRRKAHNMSVLKMILYCSCIRHSHWLNLRPVSFVARVFDSLSLICRCLTRIPAPQLCSVIREQGLLYLILSLREQVIHMHLTVNKKKCIATYIFLLHTFLLDNSVTLVVK